MDEEFLLLLPGLRALGGAGIVPDLLPKANSHGDVTVVHGNHCHFLCRGSVRDAQTADVRL